MNIFFEIAANIADAVIVLLFINSIFPALYSKRVTRLATVGCIAAFATVTYIINSVTIFETYQMMIYIFEIFLYALFFRQGKWLFKLAYSALSFVILMLANIITAAVVPILTDYTVSQTLFEDGFIRIFSLVFAKTLHLLLTLILLAILKKKFNKLRIIDWFCLAAVFAASCFTCVFIFQLRITNDENIKNEMFVLTVALIILINIIIFLFYMRISGQSERIYRLRLNEIRMSEQIKSAEFIEKSNNEIRKLKHDIRNQYTCVRELLHENKYSDALAYLDKISDSAELCFSCENIATSIVPLSAFLNHTAEKCRKTGIAFETAITNFVFEGIDEYDICSAAANMLNNAFESSLGTEKAHIRFSITNKRSYLVIKTSNRIDASVLKNNKELSSTKEDKDEHGYGIEAIRRIADKYDGIAEFSEQNREFVCELWLKYSA